MKILILHGWQSVPGGVKPTYLAEPHGVMEDDQLTDWIERAMKFVKTLPKK